MTKEAFIYEAIRTPRGKGSKKGSLHEVRPAYLVKGLLEELQSRLDLDTSRVDDVILGCVGPVDEQGGDVPKSAVEIAGWDQSVPAAQLHRFCASGLDTVNMAAMKILSGWDNLVVAGGFESMSRVQIADHGDSWLNDPDISSISETILMGVGADLVATLDDMSREDLDAYALESQQRASNAQNSGYFDRSIVPVRDENGYMILDKDEHLRPETTAEKLANLPPAFEELGNLGYTDRAIRKFPHLSGLNFFHTAGNSSGIVDGAAVVLVGSEQAGKDHGLTPRARVVAGALTSTDPTLMLTGPGPASLKCLDQAGMTTQDIDLFEMNEAFSSAVLRYMADMKIPHEITNVNGGAIALGHPLGATGAMLLGTMIDELERTNKNRALVSLCVGGGMGIATIIERP